MSYLNIPRLVFSGDFQADVNTVNNNVTHYYNPGFTEDNWVQAESGHGGSWNPDGGSTFRFVDCSVKQVCYPDGSKTNDPGVDPVIGKSVAGPLDESPAKLVDLDPQFQFTSQIWGLRLCIYNAEDEILLKGDVEPSGFKDLQYRNFPPRENHQPLGASWTSVIKNLEWGERASESTILTALRKSSEATGMLSCNLVSFGYYKVIGGERFTLGRLLGSIGPYIAGDPKWFAPARRLIGLDVDYAIGNHLKVYEEFVPDFSFSNCYYDAPNASLSVDLGGSFPLAHPMGKVKDVNKVYVGVAKKVNVREQLPCVSTTDFYYIAKDAIVLIGEIEYREEDWLMNTAGISDFSVRGEAKTLIENRQIVLLAETGSDNYKILACETKDGLSVRADYNVMRIDAPTQGASETEFEIRTYQWGKKLPGATVSFKRYTAAEIAYDPDHPDEHPCSDPKPPEGINPDTGQIIQPCTNYPEEAVLLDHKKNTKIVSDENGIARVTVSVSCPGNPRGYIDGQIFLIPYALDGLPVDQQYNLTFMGLYRMDSIIMHARNSYKEPEQDPKWSDISEIMTQYRNLYPLMSRNILDLSDAEAVAKRYKIMKYAFSRDINDPTYMPVSRDLSQGKQNTILRWLRIVEERAEKHEKLIASEAPTLIPENTPTAQKSPQAIKLNVKTKDDFYDV